MIEIGLTYTSKLVVAKEDTAIALGSGDMPVLATPRMTALMENAAMLAVANDLEEGYTTVGGHIETSHLKPSAIGKEVTAIATLTKVEGRKLYYSVVAKMDDDIIGEGTHLRFIVNKENFMSKL